MWYKKKKNKVEVEVEIDEHALAKSVWKKKCLQFSYDNENIKFMFDFFFF